MDDENGEENEEYSEDYSEEDGYDEEYGDYYGYEEPDYNDMAMFQGAGWPTTFTTSRMATSAPISSTNTVSGTSIWRALDSPDASTNDTLRLQRGFPEMSYFG